MGGLGLHLGFAPLDLVGEGVLGETRLLLFDFPLRSDDALWSLNLGGLRFLLLGFYVNRTKFVIAKRALALVYFIILGSSSEADRGLVVVGLALLLVAFHNGVQPLRREATLESA